MVEHEDNHDNNELEGEDEEAGEEKPADILLRLVSDAGVVLFKDQYMVPHVMIPISDYNKILRIESGAFKRYLVKMYYDSQGTTIGNESVKNVIQILQATAEIDGSTYPLSLRVAWHDDSIFYDMSDDKWQSVRISKDGWELASKTPRPLFSRYNQTPQAGPDRNYEGDIFDRFLSLTNLKTEEDRILLSVYIITLFIPDIPHAISQIHGEKGSAKSTLQTLIKLLVDPAKPKLLTVYNDQKEFIQQLAHNYVAFYDNLKYTPRWLSDEACKAVTGVGSTKRKLYSDDDDIVYEYRRCLGFNGLNLGLTEPDILDRSIMIELERIKKENTKQDSEIIDAFLEMRPKLLAYIFDTLVKALAIKPTIKLNDLPRMADFAMWGEAIARAMGYKELQFLSVYYDNIGKQNVEAIENSPLGQAIVKLVNEESLRSWQGPLSKALEELNQVSEDNNLDTTSKAWPRAPNSLSRRLKPLLSNLREGFGIDVTITRITTGDKKVRGTRVIRISQVIPQARQDLDHTLEVSQIPSLPSLPSPDENQARNQVQNGDDILGSDDIYRHQDSISSPNQQENRAQTPKSDDGDDGDDTCDIS